MGAPAGSCDPNETNHALGTGRVDRSRASDISAASPTDIPERYAEPICRT